MRDCDAVHAWQPTQNECTGTTVCGACIAFLRGLCGDIQNRGNPWLEPRKSRTFSNQQKCQSKNINLPVPLRPSFAKLCIKKKGKKNYIPCHANLTKEYYALSHYK